MLKRRDCTCPGALHLLRVCYVYCAVMTVATYYIYGWIWNIDLSWHYFLSLHGESVLERQKMSTAIGNWFSSWKVSYAALHWTADIILKYFTECHNWPITNNISLCKETDTYLNLSFFFCKFISVELASLLWVSWETYCVALKTSCTRCILTR